LPAALKLLLNQSSSSIVAAIVVPSICEFPIL